MSREWDLAEIGLRRLNSRDIKAFWDAYRDVALPGLRHGSLYSRWRDVSEDLVLSLYITNRSVGVFLRGHRGERHATTAAMLAAHEPELGEALGATLAGDHGLAYLTDHRIVTTEPRNWPAAHHWLVDTEARYLAGLRDSRVGR